MDRTGHDELKGCPPWVGYCRLPVTVAKGKLRSRPYGLNQTMGNDLTPQDRKRIMKAISCQ